MAKAKGRKLTKISIDEVSLVDAPANKRKFLFTKKDGETDSDSGELTKSDSITTEVRNMTDKQKEMLKLFKSLTGAALNKDQAETMDEETIKALETIGEYKTEELPEDLTKAIAVLARKSVEAPEVETQPEAPAAPVGPTVEAVMGIITSLNGLLPEDKRLDVTKALEPEERLEQLIGKVEGLLAKGAEKPKEAEPKDEQGADDAPVWAKGLMKRLEVVEEMATGKSAIDKDGDEEVDGEKVKKGEGVFKWNSLLGEAEE